MRFLALVAVLLLLAAPAMAQNKDKLGNNNAAGAPPPVETMAPLGAPDEAYMALVEAAKADPARADYAALREAYAASSYYRAYDSDPMNMRAGSPTQDELRAFVDANYALLGTHILAIEKLGYERGSPGWQLHADAYFGLADLLAAGGDGKTPATAYQVLVVNEEYELMAYLGFEYVTQALVQQDGRAYDRFEARPSAGGATIELWFDVTTLISRALGT